MTTPTDLTAAQTVARRMTISDLVHVAKTLTAELLAFCQTGMKGTQAHVGSIELACACTDELVRRGYNKAPTYTDVSVEDGIKLSFAVRVF